MNPSQDDFVLTPDISLEDLFVLIDAEAPRIMKLYQDADWSGYTYRQYCDYALFEEKGRHWWSRTRTVGYMMMTVLEVTMTVPCTDTIDHAWHPTEYSHDMYLRYDGKLFFLGEDSGLSYQSTREHFAYSPREEVAAFLGYVRECQSPFITRISI